MAKSVIHKLLTEILYGIKKLIYIRFMDKHYIKNILLNSSPSAMHSLPNFAVLEGESIIIIIIILSPLLYITLRGTILV